MSQHKQTFRATELIPGQTYRVTAPFKDYDGEMHPAGEEWRFLEKHFLPYEDGLTLMIEQSGQKRSIRLQWREETQGHIIDRFSDFVEEAKDPHA